MVYSKNLIILNIPEDDITNNVELICPSNSYSTILYDPDLPSLILAQIRVESTDAPWGCFSPGLSLG